MSHTYRRKKSWNIPTYDFIYNKELGFVQKIYFDKSSKEYLLAKNKYQRDSDIYSNCVPHYIINKSFERPFRRKTKISIFNWMKYPNKDLLIPIYIKDSGWYW